MPKLPAKVSSAPSRNEHANRVGAGGCPCGLRAQAQDSQPLRITKQSHEFVVQPPDGPLVITRAKTACGAAKGFVQPFVPQPGVTPVTEIDVLHALNDPSTMVIDMRDEDDPLDATYPDIYDELKSLSDQGGQFRVCRNAAKFRGYQPEDFYDVVTVAPAAMTELAKWQGKGYAYISGDVIQRTRRAGIGPSPARRTN